MVWIISWLPEKHRIKQLYINDFAGLPGEKTVARSHKILNAGDAPGNRGQQLDVHLQDEA